jgi:hypothetical protein
MKTLKMIVILALMILVMIINLNLIFQDNNKSDVNLLQIHNVAKADSEGGCYPWSPNYNWATGDCDLPPSGEVPAEGDECHVLIYYPGSDTWNPEPLGTYETICEWAIVGECAPEECGPWPII